MLPEIVGVLRCPVCARALAEVPGALRCEAGHAFDLARQGYVNLTVSAPRGGDTAGMLDARARFLGGGHFAPLRDAVAEAAARHVAPGGVLVEVGAGTAFYLAAALEAVPGRVGLALDLSKFAARRAARAHPRAASAVVDVSRPLPLRDGAAALVLDVFAPRNPPELARILAPDGALLLVTPSSRHLEELRGALGLLEVDPDKDRRLDEALGPRFDRGAPETVAFTMRLSRQDAHALVAMGPSAWHLSDEELGGRLDAISWPVTVTADVRIEVDRPRPLVAP